MNKTPASCTLYRMCQLQISNNDYIHDSGFQRLKKYTPEG